MKSDPGVILYDAGLFAGHDAMPDARWFDPAFWAGEERVISAETGRGTALVIETPVGSAVLRQYLRGGWPARFIHSRYVFTGYGRSRPFSEFRVLETCADLGLPSPRPVAAWCRRHGLTCDGALITREIERTRPLRDSLDELGAEGWRAVGRVIRRFHDHGLVHADLTVRNILTQEGGGVFLVDFDRACFRPGARRAFERNLQRLHRSLRKAWSEKRLEPDELAWTQLLKGYES